MANDAWVGFVAPFVRVAQFDAKPLQEALIAAMTEVGKRFEEGDFFVPEMLMAAKVMKAGLAILRPHLASDSAANKGTVVIGTVKGDLHDIGKNLVGMMLTGGGLKVIDVGTDVPAEKFVETCKAEKASVCAMSALLTTTMVQMLNRSGRIEELAAMLGALLGFLLVRRMALAARATAALAAQQLGQATGITSTTVAAILRGRNRLALDELSFPLAIIGIAVFVALTGIGVLEVIVTVSRSTIMQMAAPPHMTGNRRPRRSSSRTARGICFEVDTRRALSPTTSASSVLKALSNLACCRSNSNAEANAS